ncbi:MAG: DUF1611 domain-containing protein [Planctomycetes bacterium]|nr:DUF1611 domain-containing protein [Planctomycetota bacterium]
MPQRLIILTEGHSNPHTAKTACCVVRYRTADVVAILDSTERGKTTQELFSCGGAIPVVGSLEEAPGGNTLLIGIAPPGGKIPATWRRIILEAIHQGMDVVSGLHEFLSCDAEFAAAARARGVQLTDVRMNRQRDIARREGLREECLRIHTVGHDCSVGKMVTAVEVTNELKRRGVDAKFIATGQTGIMVEGDGCTVDSVVADFVSGATERMVLDNQHHEILLVEGQGSLVHPSYSSVTLGLLHGCAPHGLILCYEVGRDTVTGIPHMRIPPLAEIKRLNEIMANVMQPCEVIGISMNSRLVSESEARAERQRVRDEFKLPVCDVFRDGPQELTDAVLELAERRRRSAGPQPPV